MDLTKLTRTISLRFTQEEAQRLQKVVDISEKKTLGFAPISVIIKELMGLQPYKLLNDSHRKMLLKDAPEQS